MIRDLGNCGHMDKLVRIFKAWKSAEDNKCGIIFVLDELVYGKTAVHHFNYKDVQNIALVSDLDQIHFLSDGKVLLSLPWWDITKVNVLW